jgi:hypothetical protein
MENERDMLGSDEQIITEPIQREAQDIGADAPVSDAEPQIAEEAETIDYEAVIRDELQSLSAEFPRLRGISSITELENPIRYAELRDLGLSPREAYLATAGKRVLSDNRRHLSSAVPGGSGAPSCAMSRSELESARELFPGLGDGELMNLYKKVRA